MSGLDADTVRTLARMIDDLAAAPVNPSIDERRVLMRQMALDYGPPPAPVARRETRTIDGPDGPIPLRIYWPRRHAASRPIVLHIHGGGWSVGDPDAYERVCRGYCDAGGAIVVDVHYRRAPEHKFPAAHTDCEAALAWVSDNAAALGGAPSQISVTGDSAGGNIAAAVCQRATIALASQILAYPVMSARRDAHFPSRTALGTGQYFLREFDIKNAEREYLRDADEGDDLRVSPISASDAAIAALPPTLIITAEFDPLRDEGEAYAQRLRACAVPTAYECATGTIHAFVLFAGLIAKGAAAIARVGAALQAGVGALDADARVPLDPNGLTRSRGTQFLWGLRTSHPLLSEGCAWIGQVEPHTGGSHGRFHPDEPAAPTHDRRHVDARPRRGDAAQLPSCRARLRQARRQATA